MRLLSDMAYWELFGYVKRLLEGTYEVDMWDLNAEPFGSHSTRLSWEHQSIRWKFRSLFSDGEIQSKVRK